MLLVELIANTAGFYLMMCGVRCSTSTHSRSDLMQPGGALAWRYEPLETNVASHANDIRVALQFRVHVFFASWHLYTFTIYARCGVCNRVAVCECHVHWNS
jgi:hypothetical protein